MPALMTLVTFTVERDGATLELTAEIYETDKCANIGNVLHGDVEWTGQLSSEEEIGVLAPS